MRNLPAVACDLDVKKVAKAILEKRLDIIINYIIKTDIFESSSGLRKLLWETFLKPIEDLDVGPIYTIEDSILNQLLQDVNRSFVSFDGIPIFGIALIQG